MPTTPIMRPKSIRPGRPTVRTTFQFSGEIDVAGSTPKEMQRQCVHVVLGWLQEKFSTPLPKDAVECQSFTATVPGQRIDCLSIEDMGLWSLRLEQPDAPFRSRPAVAGRTWTTDICLVAREKSVAIGARILCSSLPYCDAEIVLTRPRFIVDLCDRHTVRDVRQIRRTPWTIEAEDDLDELYGLLTDIRRTLPVVVLTQPDRCKLGRSVSDFVLDSEPLGRRVIALAHLVHIPWEIGFKWTARVGSEWSAYLGAVRTYMPGLDFEEGDPYLHPRILADRILFWRYEDLQAEDAFAAFLYDKLTTYAATKPVAWGDRLFIADARMKQAELARVQATDSDDWKQIYEDEIAALKLKQAELEKEAEGFCDEAIEAGKTRDHYIEENTRLRCSNDALRARLAEKLGHAPDEAAAIPSDYEALPEWASRHLAGRVVVLPRAIRGAGKAVYEDVELVYRSLLLLANEYRNMRMGTENGKKIFDDACNKMQLRHGESITKERAGEEGDTYFVRYPTESSQKCFLERHLRKGTSKDDRTCLAIYFFWHEETQQVVVGWLPSHLDNRMT